jgi:iron(III) transport system permease protein
MPFFRRLPLWSLAAAVIALIVAAPVITLLTHALGGSTEHWSHLFQFVLPQAMSNTLLLLLGVGVVVSWTVAS